MSKITFSKCDTCGDKHTAVYVNNDALNQCKICDPDGFESQARADIDAWLRGDISPDVQHA